MRVNNSLELYLSIYEIINSSGFKSSMRPSVSISMPLTSFSILACASFILKRPMVIANNRTNCIQALQCNRNTCPTGITTHKPHLQKGLDPTNKAVRVNNYVKNMVHEVGVIAHSCGVKEPRQLRRFHARQVTENGQSVSLEDLYSARKY